LQEAHLQILSLLGLIHDRRLRSLAALLPRPQLTLLEQMGILLVSGAHQTVVRHQHGG